MSLVDKAKKGDIIITLNENAQSYKCKSKIIANNEENWRVRFEILETAPNSTVEKGRELHCIKESFNSNNYRTINSGNIRKIT